MKNRINKGFTIIEVIIVLVIAAIIMLLVFLVVPQLQRTARNTRTQGDARRVLAAAETFAANNAGTYPSCSVAGPYNTACATLMAVTGNVLAPNGVSYAVTITAGVIPALNGMVILGGATGSCPTTSSTPATGSRFVVAVAQETADATTQTSFCLSS